MVKINIVIADPDEEYTEALERYIRVYFCERFQPFCISTMEYLNEYLVKMPAKVDVLLIVPDFLSGIDADKVNTVVLLTEGRIPQEYIRYKNIKKYETAHKVIKKLIDIYAENNLFEVHDTSTDKHTRVIGVFSPGGGAGKSTISLAISLRCEQRGLSVFYLNFENIPSTPLFFDCFSENNLSHILYFLKEKSKNLGLKIEGTSLENSCGGIHYFAPPDNPFEMDEITGEDIAELIKQIKVLGKYDTIVVDMSSVIDEKNMEIFKMCDRIVCINTPYAGSQVKTTQFFKIFNMTQNKELTGIRDKIIPVLNKYQDRGVDFYENEDKSEEIRIPEMPEIFFNVGGRLEMSLSNPFGEAVNLLVSRMLEVNKDAVLEQY